MPAESRVHADGMDADQILTRVNREDYNMQSYRPLARPRTRYPDAGVTDRLHLGAGVGLPLTAIVVPANPLALLDAISGYWEVWIQIPSVDRPPGVDRPNIWIKPRMPEAKTRDFGRQSKAHALSMRAVSGVLADCRKCNVRRIRRRRARWRSWGTLPGQDSMMEMNITDFRAWRPVSEKMIDLIDTEAQNRRAQ